MDVHHHVRSAAVALLSVGVRSLDVVCLVLLCRVGAMVPTQAQTEAAGQFLVG